MGDEEKKLYEVKARLAHLTEEQLELLLEAEASKKRTLCHGFKNIETSPMDFTKALELKLLVRDKEFKEMWRGYYKMMRLF